MACACGTVGVTIGIAIQSQVFLNRCGADGRIEIVGPFHPGQRLTVLVVPEAHDFDDLTAAASSSLDFWDNPRDAEDWNDAPAHVREKPCPRSQRRGRIAT